MRLLPPATLPPRTLAITIAVPAAAADEKRAMISTVDQVCERLDAHGVPGTWGLGDPSDAPQVAALADGHPFHEFALLADTTWAQDVTSRHTLRRRLRRSIRAARRAGWSAATIVARGQPLDVHQEELVKQGISMLAVDRPAAGECIRTVRFGLWEIPADRVWTASPGRRASWGHDLRMRRQLDRAVEAGGLFHLALDGRGLSDGAMGLRGLERFLRHVQRRCEQQELATVTIGEIGQMLPKVRHHPPASSILRAA